MLLHVSHPPASSLGASPSAGADADADALSWRLLDHYGGLADLRAGVLRSPYPADRLLADVWSEVLRSSDDAGEHSPVVVAALGMSGAFGRRGRGSSGECDTWRSWACLLMVAST